MNTTHQSTTLKDTTTMTDTLTTDTLATIAARLATVLAQKTELEQHEAALKHQIRNLVDGPDTYAAGDLTIVVSTNRRFDPAKALDLIPPELAPLVTHTETIVDRDKVKALLPDIFEQAQTSGDYRVSLR